MQKIFEFIRNHHEKILRSVIVGLVFLIILNRAWISDDAYITLRTVDNFINGYGLTWNVNERVEVYTHPSWMLLLSFFYFFTHEAYLTTIFLSLALVLFTLIYLQSKIKPLSHFILVFLVLGLSNAFVDFATSGLENVLNYALFTVFFFQIINKKEPRENYFKIVFLAGLIGMTRLDLLLMILPLSIYVFFQQSNKWQAIKAGLLAVSPLIAWEIFSFIYYGYMFPNTFYAKLNSGIPGNELLLQGFFYIIASIKRDPLTPLVIFSAIPFGLMARDMVNRMWCIGCILYMMYIIKIGGDFMVGRFLTIPLLIAILIYNSTYFKKIDIPKAIISFGFILFLGLISPLPTFKQSHQEGHFQWFHGISDERDVYYRGTGLFKNSRINVFPAITWTHEGIQQKKVSVKEGKHIIVFASVGLFGFYAGPNVYIVDQFALGSAYLAHQPMQNFNNWRIGHYRRDVEQDYLSSLEQGKNLISNQELANLYDDILIKTQNKIFDEKRLIRLFNLGIYNN